MLGEMTFKQRMRLVDIATSEVYSGHTPEYYTTEYYGKDTNVPWCVIFVWYCFKEAGLSDYFYGGKKTASCGEVFNWAKKYNLLVRNREDMLPGDLVLYNWDNVYDADHIGIYNGEGDPYVICTIEGNTSGSLGHRYRNKDCIFAVIRPAMVVDEISLYELTFPYLQKGDESKLVLTCQELLANLDYYHDDLDGIFGNNTHQAVLHFQADEKIEVDGIIGPITMERLLKI